MGRFSAFVASDAIEVTAIMARQRINLGSAHVIQNELAIEALEEARLLPPGRERTEALRNAGLLRHLVEAKGVIFAKRGRPRK